MPLPAAAASPIIPGVIAAALYLAGALLHGRALAHNAGKMSVRLLAALAAPAMALHGFAVYAQVNVPGGFGLGLLSVASLTALVMVVLLSVASLTALVMVVLGHAHERPAAGAQPAGGSVSHLRGGAVGVSLCAGAGGANRRLGRWVGPPTYSPPSWLTAFLMMAALQSIFCRHR